MIDTGDHVRHASGEEWVVAFVDGDRLFWCGWPEGSALVSDCTLLKKANAAERHKLLLDMRSAGGIRGGYAERMLSVGSM